MSFKLNNGTNIFNICIVLGLPILIYGDISSPSFNVVDSIVVLTSALMFYLFGFIHLV